MSPPRTGAKEFAEQQITNIETPTKMTGLAPVTTGQESEYTTESGKLDHSTEQLNGLIQLLNQRTEQVRVSQSTPESPNKDQPILLSPLGHFLRSQTEKVNRVNHLIEVILSELRI